MTTKLKSFLSSTRHVTMPLLMVLALLLFATTLNIGVAEAQIEEAKRGITMTDPGGTTDAEGTVSSVVATAINIFSIVVGVIAVIMIIVGGLKYITSGGDSNSVTSAKNTILYAVVGLVIVVLAQAIVIFVLDEVDGSSPDDSSEEEDDESTFMQSSRLARLTDAGALIDVAGYKVVK